MAVYLGVQSILNAALGEYHVQGFRLTAPDDHVLVLHHNDQRVAVFSQGTCNLIPLLQTTCEVWLRDLGEAK